MNRQALINRFEAEMAKVTRPGVDKLMDYIRSSDFYTAPASTRFHLSCEGGLLQHSLNVLDALRNLLDRSWPSGDYVFLAAGCIVDKIPEESVIIMALLHDICKTYFYSVSTRNAKNEKTGQWEKVPFYTIDDKMPLGHGAKSAMIIKQYMELTTKEMYAIWHHMGFSDGAEPASVGKAVEMHPICLALQTADMMASKFMEAEAGNKPPFHTMLQEPATAAPAPAAGGGDAPEFQEAPPIQEGA